TEVHDCVLARSGHPIHGCDPADLEALHRYSWAVYSAIPTYLAETEYVVRGLTGHPPMISATTKSLVFLLGLLEHSDFLCFLPDAFVRMLSVEPLRAIPM